MNNLKLYLNIFILALIILLLSSCARFPAGGGTNVPPARTLYVSATMLGPMEPGYRYYLAIGIDQTNTTGPVPVISIGTTDWGTISNSSPAQLPPYYVRYSGASANNLGFAAIFINNSLAGSPYMYNQRRVGNNYLIEFEIDLEPIEDMIRNLPDYNPNNQMSIQVNFIARESDNPLSEYDSFGINPRENNAYQVIPLLGNNSAYWGDSEGGSNGFNYEDQSGVLTPVGRETSVELAGIDMISWRIETRRYQ